MQYDTIEELTLELALYPNKKLDILEDCAKKCIYGWFTVAKDGNCALFDNNGELDDISKVKYISENMILKDIEKINIPDSVTNIQNTAFDNCINLTSVMIPDSVMYIWDYAFNDCINLTSVTIPDSVIRIEYGAFQDCSKLISVTIGTGVKSIGENVFAWCNRLTSVTIPDSVISIGESAFWACNRLTSITIPNSVTSIGESAFWGCSKIKELIFKGKTIEEVKSMENYPFGIKDKSIIRCEG